MNISFLDDMPGERPKLQGEKGNIQGLTPVVVVNPMDESPRARGRPASKLESLAGRTLGLLDISKPGGKIFLDYIEWTLIERLKIGRIVRFQKPTYTKPAPDSLIRDLIGEGCDGVIEALAD